MFRSAPGKPNQRKASSWTFSGGIPEQKFNMNRSCFPKEKHQNSQKWAKFMNFSFWPFFLVWFAGATPEMCTLSKRPSAKSPQERVPGGKFLSLPWRMWCSFRKFWGWQILSHISWENLKENLPPKIHRVFHTGGGGCKNPKFHHLDLLGQPSLKRPLGLWGSLHLSLWWMILFPTNGIAMNFPVEVWSPGALHLAASSLQAWSKHSLRWNASVNFAPC